MANTHDFKKILVIQNAFIGDAILATAVLEKLHSYYPTADIHFLVRKEAASLFENHPFIKQVWIFDRSKGKWKELFRLSKLVRAEKFSLAVTLQRFGSSGFLVWRSRAAVKCGFSKNMFSFCFTHKAKHVIGNGTHEIQRNQLVIAAITDDEAAFPEIYPDPVHEQEINTLTTKPFVTVSPASVWFTKQWPAKKWIELISRMPTSINVYLLGGKTDVILCNEIKEKCTGHTVVNLAGTLSFLASAALMKKAGMNYTNDSAPLHICSAMHAPLTAVFCSTVPKFGFGPIHANATVVEIKEKLDCRPCGLHGHKSCPKGHFKCALEINVNEIALPS
ncbi:MAG: glycosyltransferase family 9 protein [Flavobacteriales bacterium]